MNRFLRQQPVLAVMGFADMLPPQAVIHEINMALKNDPFAIDLNHNRRVMLERLRAAEQ